MASANSPRGYKKERSVRFTTKLAQIALVLAAINIGIESAIKTLQMADFAILGAAIFVNIIMTYLWNKEKKEKHLKGTVWNAKSIYDL